MKTTQVALFSTIIALSIGSVGVYAMQNTETNQPFASNASNILGHVTMTVADPEGQITAYQQSDNFILRQGEDCTAKLLFFGSGNTQGQGTVCQDAIGAFSRIVLLNDTGGTCTVAETDTTLTNTNCNIVTGQGLTAATATRAVIAASTTGGAHADIDNTFTNTGSSNTIKAAAIINGTVTPSSAKIFAKQTTGSVSVGSGSTLTVQWDIDIGGTTALGSESQ